MKLYRFSPIQTEDELQSAIEHVHFESYKLCKTTFGEYLPNAGNIGIFCQYESEYEYLTEVREKLTIASENWNQKYFRLLTPIVIPAKGDVPETTYDYLYIRKPDPYRHHVGDLDFYMPEDEYDALKEKIESGTELPDARLFPSPRLEMIELHNPDCDVIAYVSTEKVADIVRSTKSES